MVESLSSFSFYLYGVAPRRPQLKGNEGEAKSKRGYRAKDDVPGALGFDVTLILKRLGRQSASAMN